MKKIQLKKAIAVLISMGSISLRDARGLLGSGGPWGLIGSHRQSCMTCQGQSTLCVFPELLWSLRWPVLGFLSHPSMSPLRLDAWHFLPILNYSLSPIMRNANKYQQKGKKSKKARSTPNGSTLQLTLSVTMFTRSRNISEANSNA